MQNFTYNQILQILQHELPLAVGVDDGQVEKNEGDQQREHCQDNEVLHIRLEAVELVEEFLLCYLVQLLEIRLLRTVEHLPVVLQCRSRVHLARRRILLLDRFPSFFGGRSLELERFLFLLLDGRVKAQLLLLSLRGGVEAHVLRLREQLRIVQDVVRCLAVQRVLRQVIRFDVFMEGGGLLEILLLLALGGSSGQIHDNPHSLPLPVAPLTLFSLLLLLQLLIEQAFRFVVFFPYAH